MLYGLELTNFLSIRTRQVIDLRVPPNVRIESDALQPIWLDSKYRAPSVVVFFGANGAGKSNILKALNFVSSFVRDSFSWPAGQPFQFSKFADDDAAAEPTTITVHFAGPQVLPESTSNISAIPAECAYTYELEIASAYPPIVRREALSYSPCGTRKRIFERHSSHTKGGPGFGLSGEYRILEKILRPDASVIATLAQLNHPVAKLIQAAAQNFVSNIALERAEPNDAATIQWYDNNRQHLQKLNEEIARLDIGIRQALLIGDGLQRTMQFEHNGLNAAIPLILESHGTRQFLRIFPWISYALEIGGIAVVDELDTSVHPLILPEILRWFYDETRNPHGAQLWMTCQSASLLEDLSKEQIYFCEKDRLGRTEIYGLRDVANVRRVDNFYRKYLGGIYGAVPRVG